MKNGKLLLVAATGFLVVPDASRAAIDDAGMKYVSAAEGLSGSIRIRAAERLQDFASAEAFETDPKVGFGASRIIYRGESDLGNDLYATYFLEFRPGQDSRKVLDTQYLDVGLRGFFGHVRFGIVESATQAIVPSADRTSDVGTSGESLAEDYSEGFRWISPEMKGFALGVSAETSGVDSNTDELVDQYDVAIGYSSPWGINIGASYTFLPFVGDKRAVVLDSGQEEVIESEKSGYRIGMNYAHSKWGFGYNFHSYKALTYAASVSDRLAILNYFVVGPNEVRASNADKDKDTTYREHVIGANYNYGRFRVAYVYSRTIVTNESERFDLSDADDGIQPFEMSITQAMGDIAYRLGAKSRLVVAYRATKLEADEIESETIANQLRPKLKNFYILYRVDF